MAKVDQFYRVGGALALGALLAAQPQQTAAPIQIRSVMSGPGVDAKATITRDGRYMAMTDWSSGDIAIRDMSTGQLQRLLAKTSGWESDDFGDYVTLSPDLRQVVYVWHEGSSPGHLRLMPTKPGAKSRVLVRNPEFAYILPVSFSSGGDAVLVHVWKKDYTAQLAWVSVTDGSVRVLRSLDWRLRGRPVLSPDGTQIAYSALPGSNSPHSHIYILAADGTTETVAVSATGVNSVVAWTPDGGSLLFARNRAGDFDLWSVRAGGSGPSGNPSVLQTGIGRILPVGMTSAGSFYYAHEQGAEDVFLAGLEPTGEAVGPVTRATENSAGLNTGPAWSPDGAMIAFKRRNQGNRAGYDLVVRTLDGGHERTYISRTLIGVPARPHWFHDSKAVLLAMSDRQERISFQRVDLATGEFTEVLPTDAAYLSTAALSPDDQTLYVVAPNGSGSLSGIVAHNLRTGDYEQVVSAQGFINNFALAPDGRTFAIARSVASQGRWVGHLSRVEVDGTGFRDLYSPEPGATERDVFGGGPMLAWTHDGNGILFSTGTRDWKLLWIPAKGGAPAFTGIITTGLRHDVVLNPDGSRIAFSHGPYSIREIRAIDLPRPVSSVKK